MHYSAKYLNLIGSPLSALFLFCFFPWLLLGLCTGRSGRFRCLGLAGSWERKEGERGKVLAAHLVVLHVLVAGIRVLARPLADGFDVVNSSNTIWITS